MIDWPLYVTLGIGYCAVFLVVGFRWPWVAMMLVIAGAPIQNNLSISGAAASRSAGAGNFSIAELNLALTTLIFLAKWMLGRRTLILGPTLGVALIYLTICALSTVNRWDGMASTLAFVQMVQYLIVAVVVFASLPMHEHEWLPGFYALLVVGVVLALIAATSGSNYVLGLHKNGLGDSLAAAVIIGVELWLSSRKVSARWWLLGATVLVTVGLVLSLSRGAWIGAVSGLIVVGLMRGRWAMMLKASVLLAVVALICWCLLPPQSRVTAADLSAESYNVRTRLHSIEIAKSHFEKDPLLGDGIALRKESDATNVIWFTLGETGMLGLVAFLFLYGSVIRLAVLGRRHLHPWDIGFSILTIAAALVTLKLVHGLVDHYWTRGSIMCAWAAVGMASRACLRAHRGDFNVANDSKPYLSGRKHARLQCARSTL